MGDINLNAEKVRSQSTQMLIALTLQFLLGMWANLFVTIPTSHPGAGSSPYFPGVFDSFEWGFNSGLSALILHMVLGLLLFVFGVRLIIASARIQDPASAWLARIGLFGILFSGINGASFLKYSANVNSFLMALGLALSFGCYTLLLSRCARQRNTP